MRYFILFLATVLVFLQGCASPSLPPVTAVPKSFSLEDDERRIWITSEEEEKRLNASGILLKDPELEDYINSVATKLNSPDAAFKIPFKIFVLKNPLLNAFAYPNGAIYVHTGIIAKMDNEAQLATLLAHEMSHCTHRHTVQAFRDIKNKTAFMATFGTVLGGFTGGLAGIFGQIGTLASVQGYSRELETEADTEGFKLMVRAGYDQSESVKIFEILKKDIDSRKVNEPFFFGSHPRLQERIDNYSNLIAASGKKGGTRNKEVFLARTKKALFINAELNLSAGNLEEAGREMERYVGTEPSAEAYYSLGEIERQKGGKVEMDKAKAHFEKAINTAPGFPEPYRALGFMYFKSGDTVSACHYFKSYLAYAGKSKDRAYIEQYLKKCEGK